MYQPSEHHLDDAKMLKELTKEKTESDKEHRTAEEITQDLEEICDNEVRLAVTVVVVLNRLLYFTVTWLL